MRVAAPMTISISLNAKRQRGYEPLLVSFAIIALIINGWLSFRNTRRLSEHDQWIARTQEAMYTIESFQGALIDAETGGRGFLLTGDEAFLTPYERGSRIALTELAVVEEMTADSVAQKATIPKIREATEKSLFEIAKAVRQRRDRDLSVAELKALAVEGKRQMDQARSLVKELHSAERTLLAKRQSEAAEINTNVFVTTLFSTMAGMALVAGMFYLVYRSRSKAEQAADEIFAERERLLLTLSGIREGVISTDRYGNITFANSIAETLLGRTLAQMSGKPVESEVSLLDATTREQIPSPAQQLLAGKMNRIHGVEALAVSSHGSETPVEIECSLLKGRNQSTDGMVMVIRDVAERERLKKTQEEKLMTDRQLAVFVEQVSDYAIFLISPDLKAATWNRGVEQVLGFTEEEFIGLDVIDAIFLNESAVDGSAKREFDVARAEGDASDDRWMKRKDGEQFWASGITTAVHDADGKLLGYNKVLRNLTERKMAEDELKILAAELSEADRNKTTFLATLAHELRNPLSPIKNTVQLLSREPLDEDVHELLDVVERQVEQMARLIDDLMDISRISRGKVELRKEVVLLGKIVDSAVEASRPFMDVNGQSFQLNNNAEGMRLYADPTRISQVVSNLLNNASKFSPRGGAIQLTIDRVGDFAEIRVKDEGMGIERENLEDVFKMFSQVAETVERGSSGLGIGLTLVRNFVELHNGTIVAESEGEGRGSCFTVRLPIAMGAAIPVDTEVVEVDKGPIRSFRVLVVDDTRAITFVMQRLLQGLQQEVRTADNGLAAIESMVDFPPDIIFSDISMPGMNGYELAKYVRGSDTLKSVYMVAMTGFGQPTDREKALAAGFDDHVVKPVDFSVIQQLLRARSDV